MHIIGEDGSMFYLKYQASIHYLQLGDSGVCIYLRLAYLNPKRLEHMLPLGSDYTNWYN